MAGLVITPTLNTINLVNGTASLDVAAGAAVDVNANLTVGAATNLDEAVAMSSKAPKTNTIKGDGTAGRVLRKIQINIENGTTAATLQVTAVQEWNGDALAVENNLANGTAAGNWFLSASGAMLTYANAAISGDVVAVLASQIIYNASGTGLTIKGNEGSGIALTFRNHTTGADLDLTTLVDTGDIYLMVTYMTSA